MLEPFPFSRAAPTIGADASNALSFEEFRRP
jgi:hypothetical protein